MPEDRGEALERVEPMEEEDSVGEAEEGESGQEEVDVDQGEVEEEETEDEAAEFAGLNRWEEQMEIREGGVFYFFSSRQLDQLDRLLDQLESKRDWIHSQARELLEDSRQVGYLDCQWYHQSS